MAVRERLGGLAKKFKTVQKVTHATSTLRRRQRRQALKNAASTMAQASIQTVYRCAVPGGIGKKSVSGTRNA
jgi:hypothetical protein